MGKLGLVLLGRALLSKSLIQFSVDGCGGCVPSLLFVLKPNYGGGNEYNGCHTHHPQPCSRPLPTHTSTGDSWILSGKSGSVSCGGHCSFPLGPGAHKVLFVPFKTLFHQSYRSSVIKSHWPPRSNSLGVLSPFARSPGWGICCGSQNSVIICSV